MNWERYNELLALRNSGNVDEAIAELARLSDTETDRLGKALVLMEIANGLRLLRRFSDARRKINEALILLGPEHEYYPRAAFLAAAVDMDEENWKGALKKLDEILTRYGSVLQTDDHKDLLEKVQQSRGMALTELKRYSEARAALENMRSKEYEPAVTLCYLAISEFELEDFDTARRDFEGLLRLDPAPLFQAYAHYYLGKIFYRRGQLAWAKAEFEKCLAYPDRGKIPDPNLLALLIDTCKGLNLIQDAARYSEMLKKVQGRISSG